MPEYPLKRKGRVVEIEGEERAESGAIDMKAILEEKMQEAWRQPEAREMKRKLSEVAKKHWKPQIEEALEVTKYAKELKARAKEINYNKKVKEVWK